MFSDPTSSPTEPRSERLRLFFAIAVPPIVRASLHDQQQELRSHLSDRAARWTRPDALHVTLRFLGATAAERVPDLVARVRTTLAGCQPALLECRGLGCFPQHRKAQVLWADIRDPTGSLADLQRRVTAAVDGAAEVVQATPFQGHVTLARLKRPTHSELRSLRAIVRGSGTRTFGRWTCTVVDLVQSTLSPEGSRYTILARFPL